jgi:hypothetical protein
VASACASTPSSTESDASLVRVCSLTFSGTCAHAPVSQMHRKCITQLFQVVVHSTQDPSLGCCLWGRTLSHDAAAMAPMSFSTSLVLFAIDLHHPPRVSTEGGCIPVGERCEQSK